MTVKDVHEVLTNQATADPAHLKVHAYTTILTVMRNLARRKFLSQEPDGRKHIFKPLITKEAYMAAEVNRVRRDLFEGDSDAFIAFIKSCPAA